MGTSVGNAIGIGFGGYKVPAWLKAWRNYSDTTLAVTPLSSTSMGLEWTNPVIQGATLEEVLVYRGTDGVNFTLVETLGVITSWTDTGLTGGTLYYYRLAFRSSRGAKSGAGVVVSGNTLNSLFYLDGIITTVGEDKYFVDNTGNERNFLITDYDFADDWEYGFPYKSASTISAPVGDAVLIAADINNYLYASDGTPNEIPVVSLFQDVDYEHKLFCKHIAQVIDDNGVEVSEPYVKDITLYDDVVGGDTLTACQEHYGVPAEDITANWVSLLGDDTTGDGSKSNPWRTLNKAASVNRGIVYVKSGLYEETGALGQFSFINAMSLIGIGLNEIRGTTGTMACQFTNTSTKKLIGFTLNGNGKIRTAELWNNVDIVTIERCRFIGATSRELNYNGVSSVNVKIKDCVFRSTADYTYYIAAPINITGCYIHCIGYGIFTTTPKQSGTIIFRYNKAQATGTSYIISISQIGQFNLDIKYNDFTAESGYIIRALEQLNVNVSFNKFKAGSTVIAAVRIIKAATESIVDEVVINYNHVESLNESGYAFIIGDDAGAEYKDKITKIEYIGNRMLGPKYFNPTAFPTTHGIMVGYHIGGIIKYNYIEGYGIGISKKHIGTADPDGTIMYNILKNNVSNIYMKGQSAVNILNNTVFIDNDDVFWGIRCSINNAGESSNNCRLRNNIVQYKGSNTVNYSIIQADADSVVGLDSDYNILISATNLFGYDGTNKVVNLTEWQALGYDIHSISADPLLNEDSIPSINSPAIGNGETLNPAYDDGLDASTNWGNDNTIPVVVTKQQGQLWDIGAYIH